MSVPSTSLDSAFERVAELVARFKAGESRYLSPSYQEAEVRKDFIDKLLIALGWDVNHDHQTNPYEQEVKVERSDGVSKRRADYAFYAAPNFIDVQFYVEAKKPCGDIATSGNFFQTIRYGWNSETPLAVLTDFEQFRVLDCRYKPDPDTALNRSVAQYHYTDYLKKEKFAEIYWLFSREAVIDCSLIKRAKELPKPKGKAVQRGLFAGGWQSIDESFLQELDEYRTDLAKAFKKHNPELDSEQLTEATQRSLDRLVFIRFLEDKGIEAQRLVEKFGSKGTRWEDFISTSRRLDGIYNGIVFKKHPIIDRPGFRVDDALFADICEKLAHINSPYDFDAIPIHILGSIYERFLGKVIVATDKRVRVEDKPEVRKAGGVYYTPEYIVRYIVQNTIGKLIEGKTPAQIAEMRFADISCGSGSFLLGVYELLLQYHGNYYNKKPDKATKGDCIERDGTLFLSLHKKRDILCNNIYGVDIDAQAVEVCQLSLFLRLLKEETTTSAHAHQMEFHETLLPSLSKNIVCGNSLIGTDILDSQLFPSDEERKLNPMNFDDAFPEVMNRGGFDAIIGNPPWISLSGKFGNEFLPPAALDYLISKYSGNTYMPNMYEYFVAKGLTLTKEYGLFGYIVPDRLGFNSQFVALRQRILTEAYILSLQYKVPFPGITADTLVFIFKKGKAEAAHEVELSEFGHPAILKRQSLILSKPEHRFEYKIDFHQDALADRLCAMSNVKPLSEVTSCTSGFGGKSQLITESQVSKDQIRTLKGDSIGRYQFRKSYWFDFKKDNITGRTTDVNKLGARPKILIRKTGDSIVATFDDSGIFPEQSLYFLFSGRTEANFKFLLALINSKLMNWFFKKNCLTNERSIAQVKTVDLVKLPIRIVDLSLAADKTQHDALVAKVDAILEAKKALASAKSEKDTTYYEIKCASLDLQIDRQVYALYGLTDEEIKIVEGNGGGHTSQPPVPPDKKPTKEPRRPVAPPDDSPRSVRRKVANRVGLGIVQGELL